MALDHVQPLIHEKAAPPRNVAETGIAMNILLRLMIKAIYVRGLHTPTTISQVTSVTAGTVEVMVSTPLPSEMSG